MQSSNYHMNTISTFSHPESDSGTLLQDFDTHQHMQEVSQKGLFSDYMVLLKSVLKLDFSNSLETKTVIGTS